MSAKRHPTSPALNGANENTSSSSIATFSLAASSLTPINTKEANNYSSHEQDDSGHHLSLVDSSHHGVERHLTLFDLVSVGVGSTVGSGIFVLSGIIARNLAGPASAVCWAISGLSALGSGACYAELAGRITTDGSSYSYVKQTMGELPAVIAALCLTYEYVVASAAIARSWGDKLEDWLRISNNDDLPYWLDVALDPGLGFNTLAFLVSTGSVWILLCGVKESKFVMNIFTMLKVGVVMLMVIGGLCLMDVSNFTPFLPKSFGFSGLMHGATTSFFGYLGFDEVCCLGGEAINPEKNMPRAVMIVLLFVTILYIVAAISLTGMQPYYEINATTGFASAFLANGHTLFGNLVAIGELVCLPFVCLITVMAHPRLQFAMAEDGLLPRKFGEVDDSGNLSNGIWLSGIVLVLISSFVPFTVIDDTISSAVLVVYSLTNSSLLKLRRKSPEDVPFLLEKLLFAFNVMCYITGLLFVHGCRSSFGKFIAVVSFLSLFILCMKIDASCPECNEYVSYFRVPFVPFLPCAGIFINWYLVAQLSFIGNVILLTSMAVSIIIYLCAHGSSNAFGHGKLYHHLHE